MPHGDLIDRANRPQTLLFDHLVGAGEKCRWHIEAERLRRLEVDDQLELRDCWTGRSAGLLALRTRPA